MKKNLNLFILTAFCLISSFCYAQTVDKIKFEKMQKDCSKEFETLSDSADSKALADALLEVASSKECGASVGSFKVIQTALSRGISPAPPKTECIIKLKSLTGDIGFSDIGAGEVQIVWSGEKLAWDNKHLAKVTKQEHLKSLAGQLKEKGICDLKVSNVKKAEFAPEKICREYELRVSQIEHMMGGENIARVDVDYYDEQLNKKCKLKVEDDDGLFTLSLVMLQVKERVKEENSEQVKFSPLEYSVLRDALERQEGFTTKSQGQSYYSEMKAEQEKLKSDFSEAFGKKISRTMSKEKFANALKFIGSRIYDHGYTRYNTCYNSKERRNLDELLFAPGQRRYNDFNLSIGKDMGGCHLTVSGLEGSASNDNKKTNYSSGKER